MEDEKIKLKVAFVEGDGVDTQDLPTLWFLFEQIMDRHSYGNQILVRQVRRGDKNKKKHIR